MAEMEIKKFPDPVLREKAKPVTEVDDSIRALMDDMADTMYANHGIGLAAPQVGVSKRVIVIDISAREGETFPLIALANPEIVKASPESEEFEEGCLSLPNFTTMVKRPSKIVVKALDRLNREVMIEADGILAIALQHEMDHLEGMLILDRAGLFKKEFYKKKAKKNLVQAG